MIKMMVSVPAESMLIGHSNNYADANSFILDEEEDNNELKTTSTNLWDD